MSRSNLAVGAGLLLWICSCGRVGFDLLDFGADGSIVAADGGGMDGATPRPRADAAAPNDAGGLDGSLALDDAGPSVDASFPACGMALCPCPGGPTCEVVCFAEPCGVTCDGDTTCSAYCWSGVSCTADWEGASATSSSGAPFIASVTAGRGTNSIDDLQPARCGASCLCPADCTGIASIQVADCGGDVPEPAGCEMGCDPPQVCSLYCGTTGGECAIQCGAERCVGSPDTWVSCNAGSCRSGPPG